MTAYFSWVLISRTLKPRIKLCSCGAMQGRLRAQIYAGFWQNKFPVIIWIRSSLPSFWLDGSAHLLDALLPFMAVGHLRILSHNIVVVSSSRKGESAGVRIQSCKIPQSDLDDFLSPLSYDARSAASHEFYFPRWMATAQRRHGLLGAMLDMSTAGTSWSLR